MKSTIRLGSIAGIDVGIHYSWFVVMAWFSWFLSGTLLPERHPDWAPTTYWATGIVAALLLFVSVLIHELAHSVVARARGFTVQGITLFLLGGVSSLKMEARDPKDEFLISAVGPATSLVMFLLLLMVYLVIPVKDTPIAAVVWYLWVINLVLALFNLLPAFPMDGGRILRSGLWWVTGNLAAATKVASRGGQIIGLLLIAVGVFEIIQGILFGFLSIAIGWFLYSAATRSKQEMELKASLLTTIVGDVMEPDPETIGPEASIADAMFGHFLKKGKHAIPVCEDGRLTGIITLTDVNGLSQERWSYLRVKDVMTAMPLRYVKPEDELYEALAFLSEHSISQAPVLIEGSLVGLLTRGDVIQHLHSRREPSTEPWTVSPRDGAE